MNLDNVTELAKAKLAQLGKKVPPKKKNLFDSLANEPAPDEQTREQATVKKEKGPKAFTK